MGSVTIDGLMEGFSSLLHHANPSAVPEFMAWVDRKVSEYKMSRLASSEFNYSRMPFDATDLNFNNSQLAKDMKRLKTMISDSNQKKETSQAPTTNLSPYTNGPLATLLAAHYASPKNSLTLKVPCVSPTQSFGYYGSPVSNTGSPQAGSTPVKPETYSALRNVLQSTARVNLSQEFDDPVGSDMDSVSSQEDSSQPKSRIDCELCGKIFLHRSSYRRHMKLHQGVFTHHCSVCDRKFTRKEHFQRHKCGRKANNKEKVELDGSFDSVNDSPIKPEWGWYSRPATVAVPNQYPLDMSSKASEEGSVDETSSVSSGQISPQQGSECSKRTGRKSSAPRKLESKSFPENDDYMSDIDESMYEPPKVSSIEVIDMSMKKETNIAEDVLGKPKQVTGEHHEGIHSRVAHETAVSVVSGLGAGKGFGVPPQNNGSPPPGFRIGDLIESAVTKYHSAYVPAKLDAPFLPKSSAVFSQHASIPSSPKMKAKMYAKMYTANETAETQASHETVESPKCVPKVEEENRKGNFLATETGTYQITTEEIESDGVLVENSTSKVIKVVKQGNYLKLKKEAQLIDGELRFICPHCNKVFHRSSNFSRHMRIHRGVFSYICSTCNRGFYRKEHFDKHKCYRKSMATTWERKTKVDLDRDTPEKCNKENDFSRANESSDLEKKSLPLFPDRADTGSFNATNVPTYESETVYETGAAVISSSE